MNSFYSVRDFLIFSCYLFAVALMTYRGIWPGLILLAATGPFFGNHPGGRFVEVYNLALLQTPFWILLSNLRKSANVKSGRDIGTLVFWVTLLLSILSFSGAYFLIESFEGYKTQPFHFLSSRDWLPHYSVLIGLLGCAMCYSVGRGYSDLELSGNSMRKLVASGLLIGPVIVLSVALLEIWIPGVANTLDKMHIRIAGYVERSNSHFQVLSWLSPVLDSSPNSLFWNRSWLSIYLVSCLPLAGISVAIHRGNRTTPVHKLRLPLVLLFGVFVYVQLVIGARAGLLSTAMFIFAFWITGLKARRSRTLLNCFAFSVIAFAVLVPILSLFDLPGNVLGLRAELFKSGLRMIYILPIFGGGAESFGFWNDLLLRAQGFQRTYSSTHNSLLQIGVGYGIIGILAILGLYLVVFKNLIEFIVRRFTNGDAPLPERIILAGMAAIIVYGCFQEWWYIRVVQLNWWLAVLGSVILYNRTPSFTNDSANRPHLLSPGRIVAIAISVICLAATQFWIGYTLRHRHQLFENVGHLEPIVQDESNQGDFRYPLLAGDGSYLIRDGSAIVEEHFECEPPGESLTGPPDPRIVCRYAPVRSSNVLENFNE